MTKKSLSRLERDKLFNNAPEFSETPPWDTLNNLNQIHHQTLSNIESQVSGFFAIEGVSAFIPQVEKAKVVTQIRALDGDIKTFRAELHKVHAFHKDRTGKLRDGEHLIDILRASEAYADIGLRIEAIITPVYHYLLAVMGETERNAAEQAARAAAAPTASPEPVAA